jgi:hypothetical protein
MADFELEEGVVDMLLERFEKFRLPRLLSIKNRVDAGERLTELDTVFLDQVLHEAQQNSHLVAGHPMCKELFARIVHLYKEICERALANEERDGGGGTGGAG